MSKLWVVIITYWSSRALCLDVVKKFSSASCVNILKWFINQYGALKRVLSDNSGTFASKEVKEFITLHCIKWSYNIAEATWTGWFLERMVRSVKRCLKKILGQARVRFDKLLTILKLGSHLQENCVICFIESPLKMMKNVSYFTLKLFSFPRYLNFRLGFLVM